MSKDVGFDVECALAELERVEQWCAATTVGCMC